MSDAEISMEIIQNPLHPDFNTELERATKVVGVEDCKSFFDLMFHHLNQTIHKSTGVCILASMRKLIRNDQIREIFVFDQYIDKLPYTSSAYAEAILNIMYDFVKLDPSVFDETLCPLFAQLIQFRPDRAIVVIALYAQKMEELENPWPMLDLLFYESKHFNSRKSSIQYITLLVYLCSNFDDYAGGRAENCYRAISTMLKKNYSDVLQAGYDALRMLMKFLPNASLPIDTMKVGLKVESVQPNILAFLLSLPVDHPDLHNKILIDALVECAQTNEKATVVLLQLATDKRNAGAILSNKDWTKKDLPTTLDTLRLFLVMFQHEDLRLLLISERRTFAEFLYNHIFNDIREMDYEDFDNIIINNLGKDVSQLISNITVNKFAANC